MGEKTDHNSEFDQEKVDAAIESYLSIEKKLRAVSRKEEIAWAKLPKKLREKAHALRDARYESFLYADGESGYNYDKETQEKLRADIRSIGLDIEDHLRRQLPILKSIRSKKYEKYANLVATQYFLLEHRNRLLRSLTYDEEAAMRQGVIKHFEETARKEGIPFVVAEVVDAKDENLSIKAVPPIAVDLKNETSIFITPGNVVVEKKDEKMVDKVEKEIKVESVPFEVVEKPVPPIAADFQKEMSQNNVIIEGDPSETGGKKEIKLEPGEVRRPAMEVAEFAALLRAQEKLRNRIEFLRTKKDHDLLSRDDEIIDNFVKHVENYESSQKKADGGKFSHGEALGIAYRQLGQLMNDPVGKVDKALRAMRTKEMVITRLAVGAGFMAAGFLLTGGSLPIALLIGGGVYGVIGRFVGADAGYDWLHNFVNTRKNAASRLGSRLFHNNIAPIFKKNRAKLSEQVSNDLAGMDTADFAVSMFNFANNMAMHRYIKRVVAVAWSVVPVLPSIFSFITNDALPWISEHLGIGSSPSVTEQPPISITDTSQTIQPGTVTDSSVTIKPPLTDSTNTSPGTQITPDNTPGTQVPGTNTTPSGDTYVVVDKLGYENLSNQILEAKFGDDFSNLSAAAKNTVRSSFASYLIDNHESLGVTAKECYNGVPNGLMKGADVVFDKSAGFSKYADWLSQAKKFKSAAKIIKPLLAKQ